MIRHASLHPAAEAVPPLAITVVQSPFGALLVTAIGAATLEEPGGPAAIETAIALSAITAGAQEELGDAFAVAANPPSEAIVRRRHAHRQAALDNGSSFVAG
jgi:hypothetical protein